ncbi:MAG: 4-hydroxy-tetrahydrodipicolinate reductase [Rickettsiaceae bacterium]|nr:4-hydroxy-tetrahydrodipicolinate reductase [Rickettsiaceae bacterium]
MSIKLAICGSSGKMGQAIINLIKSNPQKYDFEITYQFSRKSNTDLGKCCQLSEIVIDFSTPEVIKSLLKQATVYNTKLVICTTGFTEEHFKLMAEATKKIAILYAANTSIGANLLANMAAKVATILQHKDFDTEIIEAHHRYKKDAPSGTALMIAKEIANATDLDLNNSLKYDRCNNDNVRKNNEIGMSAIRAGGIYGEHNVIFASNNEVIKLQHQALNRDCFADGALIAAKWLYTQKPGLYNMQDIFND